MTVLSRAKRKLIRRFCRPRTASSRSAASENSGARIRKYGWRLAGRWTSSWDTQPVTNTITAAYVNDDNDYVPQPGYHQVESLSAGDLPVHRRLANLANQQLRSGCEATIMRNLRRQHDRREQSHSSITWRRMPAAAAPITAMTKRGRYDWAGAMRRRLPFRRSSAGGPVSSAWCPCCAATSASCIRPAESLPRSPQITYFAPNFCRSEAAPLADVSRWSRAFGRWNRGRSGGELT